MHLYDKEKYVTCEQSHVQVIAAYLYTKNLEMTQTVFNSRTKESTLVYSSSGILYNVVDVKKEAQHK